MVRYNNCSILRCIDLDDLASVRRVISCLKSRRGSLSPRKAKLFDLTRMETAWISRILSHVARTSSNYPLLKDAITRFTSAHLGKDEEIMKTIKELESLTYEHVLINPECNINLYEEAIEKFYKETEKNIDPTPTPAPTSTSTRVSASTVNKASRSARSRSVFVTETGSPSLKRKASIQFPTSDSSAPDSPEQEFPGLVPKKIKFDTSPKTPDSKRKGRPFGSKNVQGFTKKYTSEEDDRLYMLRQEGNMWKEVAKIMGDRTMASCQQRYATIAVERGGKEV